MARQADVAQHAFIKIKTFVKPTPGPTAPQDCGQSKGAGPDRRARAERGKGPGVQ